MGVGEHDANDFARWVSTRKGVTAKVVNNGKVIVYIDTVCEYLSFGENGKASCDIYNDRPKPCKNHWNCKESAVFLEWRKEKFGR